ncbi:MAG: hypothetical protein HC814_06280 [Rhodobacteraceae bacterium]|nr:hypothetical protein [Paracoccaceae bacterium]
MDGELNAAEGSRMEAALGQNAGAQALLGELRMVRQALVDNEPEAKLPESVDFHWSKIAREIERLDAVPKTVSVGGRMLGWLRYLAPTAAVAAIALFAVLQFAPPQNGEEIYTDYAPEVSPVVFQSHEESMTVIWLHGDVNSEFASPEGDL